MASAAGVRGETGRGPRGPAPCSRGDDPKGAEPRSRRGRWRAAVLLGVHLLIAAHVAHWLARGRSIGPLEPSEAGLVWTEGLVNAGLVFLALLVLSTLFLGRFFCGWGCHVVALQDASGWLLAKLRLRPKPLRSRVLAWVPVLAAAEVFLLPGVLRLVEGRGWPSLRVELTSTALWERFPGPWMALATFAVVGAGAVLLLGNKGFCTYGCPYGALFGFADRFARGRIRVNDACEGCGHCTAVCTSNVLVHKEVREHDMVVDAGCMKCLDCVSACPKDALAFAFGPRPTAEQRKAARRPSDFTRAEEVALALLFLGGLYAFRGLYGAVPFLLAVALAGGLAVLVVVAARVAWRRDVRLQHATWRRAGRVTRAGWFAVVGVAAFAAFAAQSALAQWATRGAAAELDAAFAAGRAARPGEAVARLEAAGRRAALARNVGFVAPLALERRIALANLGAGRAERACEQLARVVDAEPRALAPRLELYQAQRAAGRAAAAAATLDAALDLGGATLDAERTRALALEAAELVQVAPAAVEPTLVFARLQAALGDVATARANLARLAERHPDDPRVRARLAALD